MSTAPMSEQQGAWKGRLHEMAATMPTDLWNDSCASKELEYALERGAVGATTNPVIVGEVLQKELPEWLPFLDGLLRAHPAEDADRIAWRLIEAMAVRGARMLLPVFERSGGRKGRLSIQTDPRLWRSPRELVAQAEHFATLAPNIQVKLPVTRAGIEAIEELTARGVVVNATVSFTLPQAIATAEAIERGLERRTRAGRDVGAMVPAVTLMVGRLDDWLRVLAERDDVIVDPACLDWAGVAVMKKAYGLFRARGYRSRLLSAAYRNHLHWSEFMGGEVIVSIPHKWQRRFNESAVRVEPLIDRPVDPGIVAQLERFADFRASYAEQGQTVEQFDGFGATRRTLRQFIAAYDGVVKTVRDRMVPDPDTGR